MPTIMLNLNNMNQKGIAHILLIIILIIGIIAGVYLVQKTQIFKPKAASQMVEWIPSQGSDTDNCVSSQTSTTCTKVKFKIFGPGDLDNSTSPAGGSNNDTNGEP